MKSSRRNNFCDHLQYALQMVNMNKIYKFRVYDKSLSMNKIYKFRVYDKSLSQVVGCKEIILGFISSGRIW